jgi:hypothetical protein
VTSVGLPGAGWDGEGAAILVKAASERTRSRMSPAVMSISAAMSNPMPAASTSRGAAAFVCFFRWLLWILIFSRSNSACLTQVCSNLPQRAQSPTSCRLAARVRMAVRSGVTG